MVPKEETASRTSAAERTRSDIIQSRGVQTMGNKSERTRIGPRNDFHGTQVVTKARLPCKVSSSIPRALCIILTTSLVFKRNTKSAIEICDDVTNILNTHRNLTMHAKRPGYDRSYELNCLRESGRG